MNCSQRKPAIARILLTFWFSLAFALVAVGATFGEFNRALSNARTDAAKLAAINKYESLWRTDHALAYLCDTVRDSLAKKHEPDGEQLDALRDYVRFRAEYPQITAREKPANADVQALRKEFGIEKQLPEQRRSWLARAFERIGDVLSRLLNRQRDQDAQESQKVGTIDFSWVSQLAWGLLFIFVVVAAYFAARHIRFTARKRSRAAILDDEEPERTADEWLQNAAGLEAQGKYREAVRSLYVASLVRIDEAGVARFIRGQTNWEHYHRIQGSKNRPGDFEFLEPTRRFDDIWYGFKVNGLADVQFFKEVYSRACKLASTSTA